ncbi:hypothetical protein ABT116_29740 [Streptomyces sp. NPDC002130]|uniref:hypothetical protein n=1 Tax=Streptomyces sp. NPDC002130 TaxID=3155568 RepID=UPI003322BF0D
MGPDQEGSESGVCVHVSHPNASITSSRSGSSSARQSATCGPGPVKTVHETRPGRLGPERGLTTCERLLDEYGYEPVRETPTRIRLRNCPFHPLAAKAPDLVCGMNQAFLSGYLEGLEVNGVGAVPAPEPGECCVRLGSGDDESAVETPPGH